MTNLIHVTSHSGVTTSFTFQRWKTYANSSVGPSDPCIHATVTRKAPSPADDPMLGILSEPGAKKILYLSWDVAFLIFEATTM